MRRSESLLSRLRRPPYERGGWPQKDSTEPRWTREQTPMTKAEIEALPRAELEFRFQALSRALDEKQESLRRTLAELDRELELRRAAEAECERLRVAAAPVWPDPDAGFQTGVTQMVNPNRGRG